jgi:HlyD family secretion protein
VRRDQTVASLRLAPLDPRERSSAEARLRAAQALRNEAEESVARAGAEADQAARERRRAEDLSGKGLIPLQQLEQARSLETAAAKAREAARFRARAAAAEVEVARAALLAGAGEDGSASDRRRVLSLTAPADGRVLRVLEQSERVVAAGTPILLLGDPSRLEVLVEVLSTDAVRISPGMPVLLEGWGGQGALRAMVRTVEPAAFTKVSALGIEEQRVVVVADFVDPSGPLGDAYRVEARVVVWSAERVLQAPASAVFRQGAGWAVFTLAGGRARLRSVEAGHRTDAAVEILQGLAEGDPVVLHPPNELRDGAKVKVR